MYRIVLGVFDQLCLPAVDLPLMTEGALEYDGFEYDGFEYDGFDFMDEYEPALARGLVRTTLDFDLTFDCLAFCADAGADAPSTNKAAKAAARVLERSLYMVTLLPAGPRRLETERGCVSTASIAARLARSAFHLHIGRTLLSNTTVSII